ncbi:hypothetical protein GHT06_008690 [Daphnia sinensis]|uniref:Cystatin domain-containing protein n=1 Tax=Daphnia sinensis TaxID=1820382 RepID=A0AAD5L1R1_9CRUS|nr:hypothetical protein GHT06_008690 [Daphnia sinensis]
MSKMTGGISDKEEPANAEIQALVEEVKDQITGKMNASFNIHVGNDQCIHARIYKNLQREVSVHSIEENKTKEDPINYF